VIEWEEHDVQNDQLCVSGMLNLNSFNI